MMKMIASLLALAAPVALACTSPATGTLEDMMRQATWTTEAVVRQNYPYDTASVRIALPALATPGNTCLTWSVELILPPGFWVVVDGQRNAGATSFAGLAATASAIFVVTMPLRRENEHQERAWLRVKVRNPTDDPGITLARADGSPLWLYPVTLKVGRY